MKKSNRIVAGYHLLNLFATAEGELDVQGDTVIREYLSLETLLLMDLDDELEQLILLDEKDILNHFIQKAEDFYDDSTEDERESFKVYAKKLIRADNEISKEENSQYRTLLKTWYNKSKAIPS